MGVTPAEAKLIVDSKYSGAFHKNGEAGTIYVNDLKQDTSAEAVNTTGHETAHSIDYQNDKDVVKTANYDSNRDEHAELMGEHTQDYAEYQYATNDYGSLEGTTNNHNGTNLNTQNGVSQTVIDNTKEYRNINPNELDHRKLSSKEREFVNNLVDDYATLKGISPEQAQDLLDVAAEGLVDGVNGANYVSAVIGAEEYSATELLEAQLMLKEKGKEETYYNKVTGQEESLFDASFGEKYLGYDPDKERLGQGAVVVAGAVADRYGAKLVPKSVQDRIGDKIDELVGAYKDVKGHHVHAKAAFKDATKYSQREGFSISPKFMKEYGLKHQDITNYQRQAFKELKISGRPNTMKEHTKIAVDALVTGGADRDTARSLVAASLNKLRNDGVKVPTNIPWYK